MEDPLDLIIVGAGVYGICAASTYLQLHPDADIRVIDSGKDVGGVWSTDRLYPRFWSQTGVRLAGFPDAPFKPPEDAELYHDLPEARHLSKYLEDYVSQRGIREHCLLDTWVEGVEKQGNVWEVKAVRHGDSIVLKAKAIIVATGLSSLPQMPDLPGRDQFTGLVLHQKDFGRSKIFTAEERDPEHHRDVTIIGGSKSAAAIVYAAATDTHIERNVNWIIRSSGSGPLTFTPAKAFGKYKNLPETGSTRAIASLSIANPFLPANTWWSWFIHKTFIGNWLNSRLMSRTEAECAALANFDGRKDSLEGFEGLRSNSNVKWRVGPLGLMQRDDFGDVVARNMHVHRSDVKTLEERVVVLEDGKQVLRRLPYLSTAPDFRKKPVSSTPYRLYNLTVPITDHSIAFLGLPPVPNSYHTALVQSLYAIAAINGKLRLPPTSQMEETIAYVNAWNRRRYPAHGQLGNVMEFEMVSWTDSLLEQLGLDSHRNGGWWADLTDPCLASDYAGLLDEYWGKYMQDVVPTDG